MVLFGLRGWQQHRAIGRFGFNGFTATRKPAARLGGLLFAVAVLAGLAAPALAALGRLPVLTPARRSVTLLWSGVGLAIALAEFGLAVVAQQTMGRSWRIGVDPAERTDLITHGVFALVRNPIFTAMIIAQAGTAVMAPTWLALAGLVLLIAGIELQVRRVEEPHLLSTHGSAYAAYAARTGRFIPRVGRPGQAPDAGAPRPSQEVAR